MLDKRQAGRHGVPDGHIGQYFEDLGIPIESVLCELARRIQQGGSNSHEALMALAELGLHFEFNASEPLVRTVAGFARDGDTPSIRRAALLALGAIRLEAWASDVGGADFWSSVLQDDDDEECRIAAIEAIIRRGHVDATTDALLITLAAARSVRLAALVALSEATPTVPLVRTLVDLLIKYHDDRETAASALAALCVLISRGFRLTAEWRTIVARLLATVTEFFPPDFAAVVAIAHAKAIRCNANTAEEASSELAREFNQRRFSAAADAYGAELRFLILTSG